MEHVELINLRFNDHSKYMNTYHTCGLTAGSAALSSSGRSASTWISLYPTLMSPRWPIRPCTCWRKTSFGPASSSWTCIPGLQAYPRMSSTRSEWTSTQWSAPTRSKTGEHCPTWPYLRLLITLIYDSDWFPTNVFFLFLNITLFLYAQSKRNPRDPVSSSVLWGKFWYKYFYQVKRIKWEEKV